MHMIEIWDDTCFVLLTVHQTCEYPIHNSQLSLQLLSKGSNLLSFHFSVSIPQESRIHFHVGLQLNTYMDNVYVAFNFDVDFDENNLSTEPYTDQEQMHAVSVD